MIPEDLKKQARALRDAIEEGVINVNLIRSFLLQVENEQPDKTDEETATRLKFTQFLDRRTELRMQKKHGQNKQQS